ncbi:unnamed protein product [Rhizoctonia solani]|uniref:Uncharacterized protein n=1 Tax=Rhizoctonia solani TaxID=456999 RepID=A0A8H2W686_9AGAM|nr:unnamed protein product [Rhizoctonia solani]
MKNIFALVASFVVLAPAVLASPTARAGKCSELGKECGTGYMLPNCCGGTCSYKDEGEVTGTVDYLKFGNMKVGRCVPSQVGVPQ